MEIQSRRQFCNSCLAASAALGSGILLPGVLTNAKEKNFESTETDYSNIGYCGYNCGICPGQTNDKEARRKMVAGWKKLYGLEIYTEENIPIAKPCAGCKGEGDVADIQCQARGCAKEKKVVLCSDCDEFPCEKLRPLLSDRERLLINCRGKNVTRDEYQMSAMQFESMPVHVKRMIETGKIPSWAKDLL